MCGRYWIEPGEGELSQLIRDMQRFSAEVKTAGEICPGDKVPVICKSRSGDIRGFAMEWGYKAGDKGMIINARSESASQRPMFAESMVSRRCLLPMSAYFEWEHTGREKRKFRITPQCGGIACLTGLYRHEADGAHFVVLTQPAQNDILFIHDRMPLIVPYSRGAEWLLKGVAEGVQHMRYESEENQLRMF